MENYLKVKIVRSFGNGNSVEIELSASKSLPNDTDGLVEFDIMTDKINAMFEHFTTEKLPHMRFSQPSNTEIVTEELLQVHVTIDKKGRYVKCSTPKYKEHGIVWWPEAMKAAGINPKSFSPEEPYIPKKGTMVEYEMVDGKPKRVIRVISDK